MCNVIKNDKMLGVMLEKNVVLPVNYAYGRTYKTVTEEGITIFQVADMSQGIPSSNMAIVTGTNPHNYKIKSGYLWYYGTDGVLRQWGETVSNSNQTTPANPSQDDQSIKTGFLSKLFNGGK